MTELKKKNKSRKAPEENPHQMNRKLSLPSNTGKESTRLKVALSQATQVLVASHVKSGLPGFFRLRDQTSLEDCPSAETASRFSQVVIQSRTS
jgi:hypothetical protein